MSNPAVAKWLEEIAAAKAKAQAKEQQQQQQQKRQEPTSVPTDRIPQQTQPQTQPQKIPTSSAALQYGIITSYNLRTRKKQLRLVLPPEPRKPGPGECCGNDCEPCVNTIYWEDMAAHRERCRKMQLQYEDECRALLETSEGSGVESRSIVGGGVRKVEVEEDREEEGEEDDDDDGKGLSIRSYRPFKVLQKRYLSENTLLVVCDLPYSLKKKDGPRATNSSRAKANAVPTIRMGSI
ncbi:hypothetical protein BGZ96_004680 [Linnemannia gamsii]|uniref:Oxidoreductase-like domain-containing protein n=1 Tax=Linnemannia gamsii TaxID=64522 RepID=A0ABQ7K598_9FUNG|nr:hypothetical protein BGZ96_004680 [Linnemannia gamsii]